MSDNAAGHKALRSTGLILVGIAAGIVVGLLVGKQAAPLGNIGKFYITLIKAVAAPLLFFAILDAIITSDVKILQAKRFLGVIAVNTVLATIIGMGLANLIQPGRHLTLNKEGLSDGGLLQQAEGKKADLIGFIDNLIPDTIVEPFTQGNVLGVVFLAVLVGCALKSFQKENDPWVASWNQFIHGGLRISERVITWLVTLTPFAMFGVIAKSVGDSGFQNFKGLSFYLGTGLLGLGIQTFVVYNLWLILKKQNLREFWKEAMTPCLNAFGINSSLATLPLTLKALDNLKVSKASSRMAACIGTNLNNDGILLYEAMAVIIVTQSLGLDYGFAQQLSIAVLCVLTSMGIAGVPEAGFISLAVILGTLGLSNEILVVLLSVDWILARARSVTNVVADMTTSIVIDGPVVHRQPG
ncbi:MAG: dicarboxylate/amino acid:cation symporter [Armatimonadota bacterium]